MFFSTFSGRQTRGPPGSWAEVRPQGVPQTDKIIEVKRRLSGSFFFDLRGLGGFVWGCMARSAVSGALVIFTYIVQSDLKLFFSYFQAKYLSVCVCNHALFYKLKMCIVFAGLTRTATKISGDLLP